MTKKKKTIGILIIAAAVLLPLLIWTIWGNTALQLTEYTVQSRSIPASFDGFRIAHISDLHNTEMGDHNEKLLAMLRSAQPDIIAITGDLVDSRRTDLAVALEFVGEAVKIAPCYYVTGNHEHWSEEVHILNGLLVSYGVTVLAGDTAEVSVRDQTITISGIDDPTGFLAEGIPGTPDPDTWYGQLALTEEAVADSPYYAILLSHRPEKTEEYRSSPFDLVLSGHAHGGQIRIPFLLNGLFAPGQGYFPAYAGGEYLLDDTTLIVSRGLCINDLPRVFNRPELVVIDLVPQYNNSQKEDNP